MSLARHRKKIAVIVIGSSAGGLETLVMVLGSLPSNFAIPIIIVQHVGSEMPEGWVERLGSKFRLRIKEAAMGEKIAPGMAFVAPSNYHLLVDKPGDLFLSTEERVNYARPSIDVLFESAAIAFGPELVGVILTGANSDGAKGLAEIHQRGGTTVVQSPSSAYADAMPKHAIAATKVDYILSPKEIAAFLKSCV